MIDMTRTGMPDSTDGTLGTGDDRCRRTERRGSLSTTEALLDPPVLAEPSGPSDPNEPSDYKSVAEQVVLFLFMVVPFVALMAAVPILWASGFLGWRDASIAAVMYLIAGHGVTVGF